MKPTQYKFDLFLERRGCGCPVDTSASAEAPTESTGETAAPYKKHLGFNVPRRAGVIPLLGEMSAKQTKGSAESQIYSCRIPNRRFVSAEKTGRRGRRPLRNNIEVLICPVGNAVLGVPFVFLFKPLYRQ